MIRILKASTEYFDIAVVPKISQNDIDQIAATMQYGSIFSSGSEFTKERKMKLIFSKGLETLFLWSLNRCLNLRVDEAVEVLRDIVRREMICSTGYGNGFAIPHTHTTLVERVTLCFIIFVGTGFHYDAFDDLPVQNFALALSPPVLGGLDLKAKGIIFRVFKDLMDNVEDIALDKIISKHFNIAGPYLRIDL
jgi:hypothetical protein